MIGQPRKGYYGPWCPTLYYVTVVTIYPCEGSQVTSGKIFSILTNFPTINAGSPLILSAIRSQDSQAIRGGVGGERGREGE